MVVITASTGYADAIAGARLASATRAPLLLTGSEDLDAGVAAELRRVAAVYVLGGQDTLSPTVSAALQDPSTSYTLTRIAGADRFATASAVADRVSAAVPGTSTAPVYLASGTDHPDGLALLGVGCGHRWGGPAHRRAVVAGGDPRLPRRP